MGSWLSDLESLLFRPYNEDSAWTPLKSTKVFLTKEDPLSAQNLVALNVTTTEKWGGISNGGFWGIPVVDGEVLHFSVFMKGSKHTKVCSTLTLSNPAAEGQ